MPQDVNDVGQGRRFGDVVEKYDNDHGVYKDSAENLPDATKLPQGNLPQAPDPNPFNLGPMAPGE